MPPLDPSYNELFTFIGGVIASFFVYLGVRASNKASVKMKEVEATTDLFAEYRTLKDEMKKDADDREKRMEFKLEQERLDRINFENRTTEQLEEVIIHFGNYIKWVQDGAIPPNPLIPKWIFDKISSLLAKGG